MDINTKIKIINEFIDESHPEGMRQDWFEWNDMGVPFALGVQEELITLTKKGEETVNETYKDIFNYIDNGADHLKDEEFESLQDIYDRLNGQA